MPAGAETSFAWENPDLPVREQRLEVFVFRDNDPYTFIGQYGFHKFKKWTNVPVAGTCILRAYIVLSHDSYHCF